MRRRGGKGAPSADLLVCFPSRAHLTLMPPKPICSPSRPSEPKRHQNHHHHQLKKVINGGGGGGGGKASPLLWAKPKSMGLDISEPTSPKVTCAGQIRVRPKPNSCKNWQSMMEEIEKLHNNRKQKKRLNWVETLGFKKDIMHFLTCLRTIRFDFRCFGSFPTSHITSDDEEEDDDDNDDDDDDEDENYQNTQVSMKGNYGNESSRAVFSKLFMALQENNNTGLTNKEERGERERSYGEVSIDSPCAPPSNALLLMRSRSAPAKSWLEEREEKEEREEEEEEKAKLVEEEEEKRKKRESLVDLMRYDSDFHKLSCDIAKETWVVGGIRDSLSRSRSWKR